MTDSYDGNGSSYNDNDDDYNKQRNKVGAGPLNGVDMSNHTMAGSGADAAQLNEKANEYIRDCLTEKNRMERKFPIAEKLLDSGM